MGCGNCRGTAFAGLAVASWSKMNAASAHSKAAKLASSAGTRKSSPGGGGSKCSCRLVL